MSSNATYRCVAPYPAGAVVGPCICGSWPGGECLRCRTLDDIAWAAYSKAWPEAMRGPQSRAQRLRDAGYTPRPRVLGAGGLMLGDE
jgi:hypothetical protein